VKSLPEWLQEHLKWTAVERGLELLTSLPKLEEAVTRLPNTSVGSIAMQRYDYQRQEWKRTKGTSRQGVYCRKDQPFGVWYLVLGERMVEARKSEEKSVVFWWQKLRENRVNLTYSKKKEVLSISSARYPLPLMLDRALRSASGLSPNFSGGHWTYSAIDISRAQEVSDILGIKMERL